MGRLDILYIGTLPPHPGGSAVSCGQIVAGLAARGHAVRAISPIQRDAFRAGDPFAQAHPRVEVTRYPVSIFETTVDLATPEDYLREEREALWRITPELLARRRPDAILIGRESFARHTAEIARRHGVPSIQRFAGSTLSFIAEGRLTPENTRKYLEEFRKASAWTAPARHMIDTLKSLGIPGARLIHNAVDLARFAPRPKDGTLRDSLKITPDDIVIAHISNMKRLKRAVDIVHAAHRALERDPRLIFLMVGDGIELPNLKEACAAAGIADRFRFTGWVDQDAVARLINLSDVVALASEAEGLARVYLETQACGRALLSSDIPAAREVIQDGETGLLFPVGDIDALAERIIHAAQNSDLRAAIGRKARERLKSHDIRVALTAYEELIMEVAGVLG